MREAASNEADTAEHPEAEALAAFADGGLAPEERAAVRAHLARCAECYEVFAETLRFQRELQPASREGVLPFPFRTAKSIGVWVPAAAAAALAVGIGFGVYGYMTAPPTANVAELTAPLEGKPGVAANLWQEQRFRGDGSEREEQLDRDSFHAGVLLVDLRLSLAANSPDASAILANSLVALAKNMTFSDQVTVDLYKKVRDELSDHRAEPRARLPAVAAGEHGFDDSLSEVYLPFGKWAEAGRLAALARQPEFFESRNNRRFLTWVEAKLPQDLAEADLPEYRKRVTLVLKMLQELQTVWDRGRFEKADFDLLAAKLD